MEKIRMQAQGFLWLVNKLGNDSLHGSVYNGKSMGVYSTVYVGKIAGMTGDLDCDAEDGNLISQTGYTVGYRHKFTKN